MQTQNRLVNDLAKMMNGAAGTLAGMGREAEAATRERAREWIGGLDFVSRDEFEAVKAMAVAARDEADSLRARLDALEAKKLIMYLTPQGRGCIVTHTLYQDREIEKLRREAATMSSAEPDDGDDAPAKAAPVAERPAVVRSVPSSSGMETEVARLRDELSAVKRELAAMRDAFESTSSQLQHELDELKQQLGV